MKEEESKEKTEKKELKMNFFNKVKYSIFKIDSIVMNYLSQMIPSTTIVDIQYIYNNANS